MKTYFILLFMFLTLINFGVEKTEKNEYIEFMHTGVSSSKYIAPLIISKFKLDIELSKQEEEFLHEMQKTRHISKEDYINILYKQLVTDDETYFSMLSFIQNTSEYYTNDVNMNPPNSSENFTIIANGKIYDLYWKYKYQFLNNLTEFLTHKNCDKKVIIKIINYK